MGLNRNEPRCRFLRSGFFAEDLKRLTMNLLTTGIDPTVAYGMCIFLFGLLIRSVRTRKMAAGIPYTFYASSTPRASSPVPMKKTTRQLQSLEAVAQASGHSLSKGIECARGETVISKVPGSSANQLAAPPEFPAQHKSQELKMDSASIPLENSVPTIQAEIPALASPAPVSGTPQENICVSPNGDKLAQIGEQNARDIKIDAERQAMKESVSDNITDLTQRKEAVQAEMVAVSTDTQTPPAITKHEVRNAQDVLAFYKLPQQPFDVTPDPAYLYFTPTHRAALASIKEGIEHFRGFMVLVAEPGMGKTTLLNQLMNDLSDSAQVVFLFQTQCNSRELLCFILNELEVDHAGMDVVAMHRALNQALLEEMLRGRRFVLIVDEAQNLQEPVLETIRLLSDFETTHSKLIQIVLAGQPQLAETLLKPSLVQLRQRISVLSSLKVLSPAQTAEYVEHRLRASGWSGKHFFTSEALAAIAESSAGIPRRINNLCFNALLEGFHRGLEVIGVNIVKEVAENLNLEAVVRRPEIDALSRQTTAVAETAITPQLVRAVAAALTAETRQYVNSKN
jgi:general secretion pathway protein A